MNAVEVEQFGGPEQLKVAQVARPKPGPGQVLVKVSFASVNAMDWKLVAGHLKDWVKAMPFRPGGDFSGVVQGVGSGTDLSLGAPVFGAASGCYAEYVVADAEAIATKPEALSFEDAATLPIAGATAWQALHDDGALKPGQRLLIHGGSGGVGHFAVQIAKRMGAYVIATASPDHLTFVKGLGADEVIDYHRPFENELKGIDLVIDGSGRETQSRSYGVMKPGALLLSLIGPPPEPPRGVRVLAVMLRHSRITLDNVGQAVATKQLKPYIARTFSLTDAGEAQTFSHSKDRCGKVLLRLT